MVESSGRIKDRIVWLIVIHVLIVLHEEWRDILREDNHRKETPRTEELRPDTEKLNPWSVSNREMHNCSICEHEAFE